MNVGGLFSGIGGWELGLQRAGFDIAWHCEVDPYARAVLEQHWPGVPCYPDVRRLKSRATFDAHGFGQPVESVDVLCGGFPCQDISGAGGRIGIDGTRSGLWAEYARIIGELRPRYVCVENVAALLVRGLDRVLGDLAALGYDAEWDCLPARAFGAPHLRDRVWLVAYPGGTRDVADPSGQRGPTRREARDMAQAPPGSQGTDGQREWHGDAADDRGAVVADAYSPSRAAEGSSGEAVLGPGPVERPGRRGCCDGSTWAVEPDVGRVADGVPARMDRLRCLGNALIPQAAEWVGRRIIDWEDSMTARDADLMADLELMAAAMAIPSVSSASEQKLAPDG